MSFSIDQSAAQHAIGVQAGDYSKDDWQKTFVLGYDGGAVPTVLQMRDVIAYLESIIKRTPGTTFINASVAQKLEELNSLNYLRYMIDI